MFEKSLQIFVIIYNLKGIIRNSIQFRISFYASNYPLEVPKVK